MYLLTSLRAQRPSTKLVQVKKRNKSQIEYKKEGHLHNKSIQFIYVQA
jgi:hypothetical protein